MTTLTPSTLRHHAMTVHWLLVGREQLPQPDATTAPDFLAGVERDQHAALTVPKRRADWLLGRWTAKQIVHDLLTGGPANDAALRRIVIARRDDGSPYAEDLDGRPLAVTLSISHSHGHAFCAAVAGTERPLGADIEYIEPRSPLFAADYFTDAERDAIPDDLPSDERDQLVTAIWSGKEAALKAVRAGLTVDTRTISCLFDGAAPATESWTPFDIVWQRREAAARPGLAGLWRRSGPFVLTLALPAPDGAVRSAA